MIESALPAFSLARAGQWFLHSGIHEPSGGFSRFYRSELKKNLPVSTEISGYAAMALLFLYRTTNDSEYLDAARSTTDFLAGQAFDESLRLFPFEHPSPTVESPHLAYFFDCGIIVRSLLDMWRETREDRLLEVATAAAQGMSAFWNGRDYDPILTLPDKKPLPRTAQWSTAPGCYQAKSALAWWELSGITGDDQLRRKYMDIVESGMRTCSHFLAGADERLRIMDRLHAYCYFLEALSPLLDRTDCLRTYTDVMTEAARHLRELAPEFVRSDVYAQILRARVRASHVIAMDVDAAREEAAALTGFQSDSADPRLDGGFIFGRRAGLLSPHVNPVSTTFAIQALEMWRAFEAREYDACLQTPI